MICCCYPPSLLTTWTPIFTSVFLIRSDLHVPRGHRSCFAMVTNKDIVPGTEKGWVVVQGIHTNEPVFEVDQECHKHRPRMACTEYFPLIFHC